MITNENYFEDKEHMSVSRFKSFNSCEARALAMMKGEWDQPKSTALLVGSYVDAWFEGTLEDFKQEHEGIFSISIAEREDTAEIIGKADPSFITKNNTIKRDKLPEAKRLFPQAFDKVYKLKADYVLAEEIIERVQKDKLFMEYMGGEKQVVRTAEMFNTPWKIKIDSLCKDKIVDLKVMKSMDRVMGKSFIEHWGYDLQMAVYQRVEWLSRRKSFSDAPLPTYLAVVTKESPSNLEIIHIPQWRLDECLQDVKSSLPRIMAIVNGEIQAEGCGQCDYCRSVKELKAPVDFDEVGFSTRELKAMKGEL